MKKILTISLFFLAGTTFASTQTSLTSNALVSLTSGAQVTQQVNQPWSGLGMNYGHFSGVVTTFSTTTVQADMTYLYSKGIRKIRLAMTTANSASDARIRQAALIAKQAGMYVIYGNCTCSNITRATWITHLNTNIPNAIAWASANNIDEFSMGNEEELHNDDIDPTDAQILSDIKASTTVLKVTYPTTPKISYQASCGSTPVSDWTTAGAGDLDYVGFNCYDTNSNFNSRITSIFSSLGAKAVISEWNDVSNSGQGGFLDYGSEKAWADDVNLRFRVLKNSGIPTAYFFTYKDGASSVTADSFAVSASTGLRKIVANVLGLN